ATVVPVQLDDGKLFLLRVITDLRMQDHRVPRPSCLRFWFEGPPHNLAAPPGRKQASDDEPPVLRFRPAVVKRERRIGGRDGDSSLRVVRRQDESRANRQRL